MSNSNDIGFIISKNQTYKSIYNLIIDLLNHKFDNQYVCFTYNDDIITNKLHIPILPITEAKFWNGKMFIFDLEAVDIVKNFTNLTDIFYYMDNTEWVDYSHINYFDLKNIYEENTKIKIIASNNDIYKKYQECWNKNPIAVMETLSYENFKESIFRSE